MPQATAPSMPVHDSQTIGEVAVRRPTTLATVGDLSVAARVVYMGNNPNRSVYMPGTLRVWEDEDERMHWAPTDTGATIYIFSRFDTKGRPIRAKMMSDGRVFDIVHNVDHLANFLEIKGPDGGPEFEIFASPDDRDTIEKYARLRRDRMLRNTEEGPALLALMGLGPS